MAARSKAKRRAPLIESDTEEALRRRGTELLGLILLALAALATAMFWTYSPDDPSLFSATDAAPQNALGLVGASIADPMHRALGWAAYGIPVALAAWGLRLVLHAGETRAVKDALGDPANLAAALGYYRAQWQPELQVPELAHAQDATSASPPQPTLYLHGADDGCIGADLAAGVGALLPGAGSRVEVLDDCGHFLQVERPDEVSRLVVEFLAA